jgi:ribonuclease E
MAKKMLIDATHAEETRVVVVDGNKVEEFDFESENKRQLAGNIYLAKVTRVEPSLQAAFVDYGGNRHGFLAFSEIHPDYYQIPVADREALLAEERDYARAMEEEEDRRSRQPQRSSRSRPKPQPARAADTDPAVTAEASILGMDVVDLGEAGDPDEATSHAFLVHETPVEEPADEAPAGEAHDHDHDHDYDHDHDHDAAHDNGHGAKDAAAADSEIESIAEEDVAEEIRQPRKPRARKYKIQEVVKVRQIMLVQVVKEERGNKGAALTTYLSLAGRFCVLMPNTARGGGISRKITNAVDRKKLKEIAVEIEVPDGAGLIIRTAGAQRTKAEIKRDYEYLQRLWEQIRELTLRSVAPAKIYEEGDLIKRSIRDLYNKDIDEVFVEGEAGYRTAKDFMKMIMPSHSKNVKLYHEQMPLFARYQVESYLSGMFNPVVQLKSGGYIVIGITEALVAIDVNSGRATKEGSIEETALKTNLEAAEEIARQLRLRDLAGLIVIDFIDMEERKNNASVEKKLKDKLKTDRARIQIGRISGFGLMEMSRQRLRPGMLEATTAPCPHCHGTGLIRSDDSLALTILRQLEEEGTRKRSKEVLLKAPIAIVNFLINQKREHVAGIEARYGMAVRIEADPSLISPDFSIEKFKTATRVVSEAPVISASASLMAEIDEDEDLAEEVEAEADEAPAEAAAEVASDTPPATADGAPAKKKRRRRRRKKPSGSNSQAAAGEMAASADDILEAGDEADEEDDEAEAETEAAVAAPAEAAPALGEAPAEAAAPDVAERPAARKPSSRSRSSKSRTSAKPEDAGVTAVAAAAEPAAEPAAPVEAPVAEAAAEPAPARKTSTRKTTAKPKPATEAGAEGATEGAAPATKAAASPKSSSTSKSKTSKATPKTAAAKAETGAGDAEAASVAEPAPMRAPVAASAAEGLTADPAAATAPEPEADDKPKRRGWWSLGR